MEVTSAAQNYNGQGIRPVNKIDLTYVKSIVMEFYIQWGSGTYRIVNLTVGDQESFVQYKNYGVIKTSGLSTNGQPHNSTLYLTLDTNSITGFHDVIASVSSGDSGNLSIIIRTIRLTY